MCRSLVQMPRMYWPFLRVSMHAFVRDVEQSVNVGEAGAQRGWIGVVFHQGLQHKLLGLLELAVVKLQQRHLSQ